MKDKLLIIGGSGLVGNAIYKNYASHYDIVVADKKSNSSKLDHIYCDIFDANGLNFILDIKPRIIINCVNLATIFSRHPQLGYGMALDFYISLFSILKKLTYPKTYIQVGTTGTGGLGFEIPFTHGENIRELPILHKAAFAGIVTNMLLLLSRSPQALTKIIEVKPGLCIFNSEIVSSKFDGVWLNTIEGGESGDYTLDELELLTSYMGFTTAKRVADKIINTMDDGCDSAQQSSKYNIIQSINNSVINSDEVDRDDLSQLVNKLSATKYKNHIIATGNLGPPTITRDLILSHLVVNNELVTEEIFNNIFQNDISVAATIKYIKTIKPELYKYLMRECNYANYKVLSKLHKHEKQGYQLLKKKIDTNTAALSPVL